MALLSKALEEYKLDFGTYPPPRINPAPITCRCQERALSPSCSKHFIAILTTTARGAPGDPDQKIYLPELDPADQQTGLDQRHRRHTTNIIDPWGNEYCYRTRHPDLRTGQRRIQIPRIPTSISGPGQRRKTNADPKDKDCRDDIRN